MDHQKSQSLFTWLSILPVCQGIIPKPELFQDGILISKILQELDPDYFNLVSPTPPLVKIVEKMKIYFINQAGYQIPKNLDPKVGKIVTTGDLGEVTSLVQILLGCAVNSPKNQDFITNFSILEENVQRDIMKAIQELQVSPSSPSPSTSLITKEQKSSSPINLLPESHSDYKLQLAMALEEIHNLKADKDDLTKAFEELRQNLTEKKEKLTETEKENGRLLRTIEDQKRKFETLHEEKFLIEQDMEEQRKAQKALEKKLAEASLLSERVKNLEDEIDVLREEAERARKYEHQIKTYRKRLDELSIIENTKKELEEKYEETLKEKIKLEERSKTGNNLKPILEDMKKELAETQSRYWISLKVESECREREKNTKEKLDKIQEAYQRLQEENRKMAESLDDFEDGRPKEDAGNSRISVELPLKVREELVRLRTQNKHLQEELSLKNSPSNDSTKIIIEELRKSELELNKQLLEKELELKDLRNSTEDRVLFLQASIAAKEEELRKKEIQYNKCMEKAKKVIETLGPTAAEGGVGTSEMKDFDLEKARAIREMEEKLLTSAFFNFSIRLNRNAVEARNNTLLGKYRNTAANRRRSEL